MNRIFIFTILSFAFFTQCCESLDAGGTQESEKRSLTASKLRIVEFIKTGTCAADTQCGFIGFGAKPCGGPWEYLVYPLAIDTTKLFRMIAEHNKMEKGYNQKWGIMSDCSVPPPPDSVRCVNGECAGYYNGMPKSQ